jgi:hypothetical protein
VRPGLSAAGVGRGGQLGDPLLVAALAFGGLGLQLGLGRLQPGQPPGGAGQLGREVIAARWGVLVVLGLVGVGGLPQDLRDLFLELDQGAVGPAGGIGGHLGAVQGDHAKADQPGRQLRVVIIAATDKATRDRYLRWLSEQGGGGYFAMGETWGVGSDFAGMARRAHDAIGGTVCILANGICAPLAR